MSPLEQSLVPFVNAKLNPARDGSGFIIPCTTAVDIFEARIAHIDADVRAVTREGIRVFFDSETRVIPWDDIGEVHIVRKSDAGRVVVQSFRPGAELAAAA